MKTKILLLFSCFLMLTNCGVDDDIPTQEAKDYIIEWHLIDVEGGIAGVDHQFDLGTVIWSFNSDDNILTITNNNDDDTKEDLLDSGAYDYSILEEDSRTFFIIDGTEYGELLFSTESVFTIDGNEFSDSFGSDGFIYTFNRVLIEDN